MNLRALRAFTYLIEDATLARAAARLNLSQSAVSRLLVLLEEEFGVALFDRGRKRLVPTPAAERFYPEAVRILSRIDAIPAFLDEARRETRPPLRIICQTRILNALVLPAMATFAGNHPDVPMKLDVRPRRDLGRLILTGEFDVGISTLPLPVHGLETLVLASAPVAVLLPAAHPLAARAMLSAADLRTLPYVALDATTILRQMADRELALAGQDLPAGHEVSTGEAAYRLVRAGLGFTFADRVAVADDMLEGMRLVPWDREIEITYGRFEATSGSGHSASKAFALAMQAVIRERARH